MKASALSRPAIGGLVLSGLCVALGACGEGEEAALESEVVLFDGTDLDRFTRVGDAQWVVNDGYVEAAEGSARGFLLTKERFADFSLTAEVWASDFANSGIFIRCADPDNITPDTCYEVNVYDRRPDPAYRTGAIVHIAKPKMTMNAADRWNTMEISAVGNRLVVHMNGELIAEAEDDSLAEGHIGLQYGSGTVRFRNVRLERVDSAGA